MKTYTTNIKGRDYLYAYDKIFVAKGKTIQKNKLLGPVASLADISLKKRNFEQYLAQEEQKLRVGYWKNKIQSGQFVKCVSIEKLEKARAGLYRAKDSMGSIASTAMETAFLVDFIFNSNKIEGSKIPRAEVESRVRTGTGGKNEEVGNTMRAMYFVDHNKFKFNAKNINKLHSVLLAHEPDKLGFRHERVVVANSEVTDWHDVKPSLKSLIDWYNEAKKTWYPPELAFTFYYRFERTHPFVDGNGRTGRLLMNRILKDNHYHPMIIWNKRRQAHLMAFEKFGDGRGANYFQFMADQFIKTHEVYIEKIQKAFDLEEQMKYFLEPSKYNLD